VNTAPEAQIMTPKSFVTLSAFSIVHGGMFLYGLNASLLNASKKFFFAKKIGKKYFSDRKIKSNTIALSNCQGYQNWVKHYLLKAKFTCSIKTV
jgi:hypothetical protein